METKRAAVERLIDDMLDELGERTEIDFVTDVAAVLPIVVIAEMLGLPAEDRPLFFRWTNETLGATDPEYQQGATVQETTARAVQAQKDYFMRMVDLRRRQPTDDFIGILANAKLDGASVLAITGHHYSDLIDTDQQQDVDLSRVWPLIGHDVPADVQHLHAVGFWSATNGDVQSSQLRVVFGRA